MTEQEPDQIDMMNEDELRAGIRELLSVQLAGYESARRDAERVAWMEDNPTAFSPIVRAYRAAPTTAYAVSDEREMWVFEGWSISGDSTEYKTLREAIDSRLDS